MNSFKAVPRDKHGPSTSTDVNSGFIVELNKDQNFRRPIILFFENNQQLENFENSAEFKD